MKNLKFALKEVGTVLGLCVWVGIATIAAQFIVAFPMSWILGEKLKQPVWMTVYMALAYILAMLIVILLPIWIAKVSKSKKLAKGARVSREELGLKDWPTFSDIGLAPVSFIVYLVVAAGLAALMSIFPWFDASEAQNVGFSNLNPGMDRVVAFLALVVCAPIAEEIIFRGWLYGKLRKKLPLVLSILLVSILFGLMHGQWNVGVNVFVLSAVMCLQREITGTVYSGILLHMIKNGVAFYILYVMH